MRKISLALATSVAAVGPAAAQTPSMTWYVYTDETPSAFLAVLAEGEIDSPEPHYPFLMTCAPDQEWMMMVSNIDAKQLGTTIANGEQPIFSLVVSTPSGKEERSDYYPDMSFSQMAGLWEYSTIWDLGALDHLVAAKEIRIRGTGIDMALPTKAMTELLKQFKSSCEGMGEMGAGDPETGENMPP